AFGVYSSVGAPFSLERAIEFIVAVLRLLPPFSSPNAIIRRLHASGLTAGPETALIEDILAILDQNEKQTVIKQLIDARLGQGEFRKKLDQKWGEQCAVFDV